MIEIDPYEECPAGGEHDWVAGMAIVHVEDVLAVAERREVECQRCDRVVGPGGVVS